ncbi:HU family DNA-binding protein [Spiribacter halobius]|uniref:DNA-binding protein n=1 Tax=Sediminicurvatus halobius TaxID=2182432 RepID=A0A2U2N7U7_9GAMM|nr:HU family DNA-binding protein [Spiribacter halobius]PWG65275.1 DNA-binding protein [Spiribacter halobius]UEX78892.1 HU family DNA-binding protein [Spiribacter halobius]
MNKSQLIDAVRDNTDGVTRKTVSEVVDALFDTIQDTVADGTDVSITGFGRFTRSERAARTGRNPQTGESIRIAASKVPAFRPGKAFKDQVNR